MPHFEVISTNYRFGRIKPEYTHQYIKGKSEEIYVFLTKELGLKYDAIYVENYKSPEPVIVFNEPIPMAKLKMAFPQDDNIRFTEKRIDLNTPWVAFEGSTLMEDHPESNN